jgi:hypothetical protein
MLSDGSKDTGIADGVDHVRESIGNGYAATPRRFVGGAGATLRGMAWLLVLALALALASSAQAQAQAPVSLGTADSFGVLGGSAVTNTGPTVVNGDLGVSPGTAVTGFPPGTVNGTTHAADAAAAQAQSDLTTAYNDAAGRACNTALTGQDLGGLTLTSGAYCFSSSAQLTGTLTLDAQGDPNAVFIFQIGSTLTTASGSNVNLINGAQSCNVFWQVGSSATLGTTTTFRGNILALTSITATTGATVDGRLLARNGAVTLDSNTVTRAQCATPDETGPIVDIGGGGGNRCIARDFRLRIRARDQSGIRRIEVFLDGSLIKRTTRRRFFVLIRAERLGARRHTIRVVARDRVGNRTVINGRFTRCDRPVLPDLTG